MNMYCVPEACAETRCFFAECHSLPGDFAMMLPPTLNEFLGSQALALPSAVDTHRSSLCPHSHAPFCCASTVWTHQHCYKHHPFQQRGVKWRQPYYRDHVNILAAACVAKGCLSQTCPTAGSPLGTKDRVPFIPFLFISSLVPPLSSLSLMSQHCDHRCPCYGACPV